MLIFSLYIRLSMSTGKIQYKTINSITYIAMSENIENASNIYILFLEKIYENINNNNDFFIVIQRSINNHIKNFDNFKINLLANIKEYLSLILSDSYSCLEDGLKEFFYEFNHQILSENSLFNSIKTFSTDISYFWNKGTTLNSQNERFLNFTENIRNLIVEIEIIMFSFYVPYNFPLLYSEDLCKKDNIFSYNPKYTDPYRPDEKCKQILNICIQHRNNFLHPEQRRINLHKNLMSQFELKKTSYFSEISIKKPDSKYSVCFEQMFADSLKLFYEKIQLCLRGKKIKKRADVLLIEIDADIEEIYSEFIKGKKSHIPHIINEFLQENQNTKIYIICKLPSKEFIERVLETSKKFYVNYKYYDYFQYVLRIFTELQGEKGCEVIIKKNDCSDLSSCQNNQDLMLSLFKNMLPVD